MRPNPASLPTLILTTLLSLLSLLGDPVSGDDSTPQEGPLRLVYHTESDGTRALEAIDLIFDRPMVPIADRGRSVKSAPLQIEPKLVGTFTWVGSSTLRFEIDEPIVPGTRLVCRVPSGTASLWGNLLESPVEWTIEYRAPQVLSILNPTEAGGEQANPFTDPFLIEFDRAPSPEASGAVYLQGAGGSVPLEARSVSDETLDRLAANRPGPPPVREHLLAVAPRAALSPGKTYELIVPRDLPMATGDLPLRKDASVRLRTPSSLRVFQAKADPRGILLYPTNRCDPERIEAVLELTPAPERIAIRTKWETPTLFEEDESASAVLIEGSFVPGEEVTVRLAPGLTDLFGLALETPRAFHVTIPHREPRLEILPESGLLIPGPREYVRVQARNVGPVRIRASWIHSPEMLVALSESARARLASGPDPETIPFPWETRWNLDEVWSAPAESIDEMVTFDIPLAQIPNRPRDAQALWIETVSEPADASTEPEPGIEARQASALIQTASLGISSRIGSGHGLLWVTDLISGAPALKATVSLWSEPSWEAGNADGDSGAPGGVQLWEGQTDASGLAWCPGIRDLSTEGHPRYAMAEHRGRKVWLVLDLPTDSRSMEDALPVAAHLVTDRPVYRPGDTLNWRGWVRLVDHKGIRLSPLRQFAVEYRGPSSKEASRASVDDLGTIHGSVPIPESSDGGPAVVALQRILHNGELEEVGRAEIWIDDAPPALVLASLESTSSPEEPGTDPSLTGRIQSSEGSGLGDLALDWELSATQIEFLPAAWSGWTFGDLSESAPHSPPYSLDAIALEAPSRTDRDGAIQWALRDLRASLPSPGDWEIRAAVHPRGLFDPSAERETTFRIWQGPHRMGLRSLVGEPEFRGTPSWEFLVVGVDGEPVEGIEVELSLHRSPPGPLPTGEDGRNAEDVVETMVVTSEAAPRAISFEYRNPGTFRLEAAPVADDEGPVTSAAYLPKATPSVAGVSPLRVEFDGKRNQVRIPGTPPGGAHTLLVVEGNEILGAQAMHLRGGPEMALPSIGNSVAGSRVTAIQVGGSPLSTADSIRQRRSPTAVGHADLPETYDGWQADLRLIPASESYSRGDTLFLEVELRNPAGKFVPGDLSLSLVEERWLPESTRREPVSSFLSRRRGDVHYDESRTELALSGERRSRRFEPLAAAAGSVAEPVPQDGTRSKLAHRVAAPLRSPGTLYWKPTTAIGKEGRVQFRIPLTTEAKTVRLLATASTFQSQFATAELSIPITSRSEIEFEPTAPTFAIVGDQLRIGATIHNHSSEKREISLHLQTSGGLVDGEPSWKGKIDGGKSKRVDFKIASPNPGPLALGMELRERSGARLADWASEIEVFAPAIGIRRIEYGRAAPRFEHSLDLAEPELMRATSIDLLIAPSLLSELGDPIRSLTDSRYPGREPTLSRIRGWNEHLILADWIDTGGITPEEIESKLRSEIVGVAEILSRRPSVPLASESLEERLWVEDAYLDAYTFETLGLLRDSNIRIPDALIDRADRRAASWIRFFRTQRSSDVALSMAAHFIELRIDHGKFDFSDESLIGWMLSRRDRLGAAGSMYLAGALQSAIPHLESTTARRVEAEIRSLVDAIEEQMVETGSGAYLAESLARTPLPFSSTPDDRMRATTAAIRFLGASDPNHRFLPPLVGWVTSERRAGTWANGHETALAVAAIRTYVGQAERVSLPVQGRLVLGLSKTEGLKFTPEDPHPRLFRFDLDELASVRRPKPESTVLPLTFETNRMDALFYQLRLEDSSTALSHQAEEFGLAVNRTYRDPATGQPIERWRKGQPVEVALTLASAGGFERLWITDPFPAGAAFLDLSNRHRPDDGGTRPGSVGVRLHGIRDGQVELLIDSISPGVHEVRYLLLPRLEGEYGIAGTFAEVMYQGPAYGRSAPARVEVR